MGAAELGDDRSPGPIAPQNPQAAHGAGRSLPQLQQLGHLLLTLGATAERPLPMVHQRAQLVPNLTVAVGQVDLVPVGAEPSGQRQWEAV